MPAEYVIDRQNRIVMSRAWGRIGTEDFRNHGKRLLSDPNFSPDFRQLWDFTGITESIGDFDALASLAQTTVFSPTSRRAILAPSDVVFGIARTFQMLRESKGETGIRVFREREPAMRWLETGEDPTAAPGYNSANPLRSSPRRA
jgi:hypothetical protein